MKRIIKFSILILLCIILHLSTYGWHFKKVSISSYVVEQEDIVKNLKKHVAILSDEIGWRSIRQYENLEKSARYIADVFNDLGYKVTREGFNANGKKVYNIVAKKKGIYNPDKIILVGAHYDTYFNPGADSNASGVAALLELARLFSNKDLSYTLRLVAFVNTEDPFFATENMGSLVYAKTAKESGEDILFAMIFDSIGMYSSEANSQRYPFLWGMFYPNKANFVMLVGNMTSLNTMNEIKRVFRDNIALSVESTLGYDFISSDQWAFWKMNYPAILITDTGPYRNRYYHSIGDVYQILNYTNIAQIVYAAENAISKLAQ